MLNLYDAPKTTFFGHNLHKRNLIYLSLFVQKLRGWGLYGQPRPVYKNLRNNSRFESLKVIIIAMENLC